MYTTGAYQGTADFDPGPSVYNLTSAGGWDIFVSKLDPLGNFVWAKDMGGNGLNADIAFSIVADPAGNIYTTGYFNGTADFDPGPGTYTLTTTTSNDEIFISKLNSSGSFVWAKEFIGSVGFFDGWGKSIVADASGNLYITGFFGGTIDFDPGPTTFNLTAGGDDVFLSILDSSGAFLWAGQMGGTSMDIGQGINIDAAGNIYITGYFQSTNGDFDPTAGTSLLTTAGNSDIFILKLGNTLNVKENLQDNNMITVYPNPTSGQVNILVKGMGNFEFKIINATGENILVEESQKKDNEIDLSSLRNGIYFLSISKNGELISAKKIVKQ